MFSLCVLQAKYDAHQKKYALPTFTKDENHMNGHVNNSMNNSTSETHTHRHHIYI